MTKKKLTALFVCIAVVLSFAACNGTNPEQSSADNTSVQSPDVTSVSTTDSLETDAVDVTSEVTTAADITTEAVTTAEEITSVEITTDTAPATSAPADTTPEIPSVTTASTPVETTPPEETTVAETTSAGTDPVEPDPLSEKKAYYANYCKSDDFRYAGSIKKADVRDDSQHFVFVLSDSMLKFSGDDPDNYVFIAEKEGQFILKVVKKDENGTASTQYYRSEKKEGESFADFTADLGLDELGTINREDMTSSEFVGTEIIDGTEYDKVEITVTVVYYDEDGKETGGAVGVPIHVYVTQDTHVIFRVSIVEEQMSIGGNGQIEVHREELTIDYLTDFSEDIPADAVFTNVATSELSGFYQAALLAILLGA